MNLQAFAFVVGFAAILSLFIYSIYRVSKRFSGRVAARRYSRIESAVIAGIMLGVIGMFQPWKPIAYKYGYVILFFATLGFIV
jgi:hypothetical protein